MTLKSKLFAGDKMLEAASVSDPAHVTMGASGPHVAKIQAALIALDQASITPGEVARALYGPSTAFAVLAFKKKRNIINPAYQTKADNIVGKMTMASLDEDKASWDGRDSSHPGAAPPAGDCTTAAPPAGRVARISGRVPVCCW